MANTDYLSKLFVAFEGQPLEELTSFELNGEQNLQKIITIMSGLSGFSTGAPEANISLTAAVPIDGPEYDFWNTMRDESWVTIQVGVGKGDFASKGKIQKCRIQGATEKAVEISVDWTGRLERIE